MIKVLGMFDKETYPKVDYGYIESVLNRLQQETGKPDQNLPFLLFARSATAGVQASGKAKIGYTVRSLPQLLQASCRFQQLQHRQFICKYLLPISGFSFRKRGLGV